MRGREAGVAGSCPCVRRRSRAGLSGFRNVAVAVTRGPDEELHVVYGISRGPENPGTKWHAEDDILAKINNLGKDQQILALYTEREPCVKCDPLINQRMAPGAEVTYSFRYPNASECESDADPKSCERLVKDYNNYTSEHLHRSITAEINSGRLGPG